MSFEEINENEFMEFVNNEKTKNFWQTSYMKKRFEMEGKSTYLVGVKKNKKIIAASLIVDTNRKFLGKKIFEAYKGFILDYNDKEILKFMTIEIKKFLKNKNAMELVIDPYIVNVSRDKDGNIIDGVDNRHIKDYLKELGYKTNKNYPQVKWCYCLDINGKSSDELFSDMKSTTRNIINKTISKFKLNVRTLKKEELNVFKKITSETSDRRNFHDKTLKYYEDMYDAFGDNVKFQICELNCSTYIDNLNQDNIMLNNKINNLSSSKANINKKKEIQSQIEFNNKRLNIANNLKEEKGNIIPLACAMFILYGDEIVYLFSGSYEELMDFYGQYRLQWEIIKYASEHNYKRYNFYGIEDLSNKEIKEHGIYDFKRGFGGYVEELIGSFILPINFRSKIYHILKNIKNFFNK